MVFVAQAFGRGEARKISIKLFGNVFDAVSMLFADKFLTSVIKHQIKLLGIGKHGFGICRISRIGKFTRVTVKAQELRFDLADQRGFFNIMGIFIHIV